MEAWQILIFPLIAGLLIIFGFLIAKLTKKSSEFTTLAISMAFGVMIMLSFFELLPEAMDILKGHSKYYFILVILFIGIGIGILKFLDLFIPDHDDKKDLQVTDDNLYHIGVVSSIALLLHNILEGMTIYTTAQTDLKLGILTVIGVGLHNIPMGMVIYSTLSKTKDTKKKKLFYLILVSISTFIGGLIVFLAKQYISELLIGIMLCITLGMIIYIAFFELLKEILESKDKKRTTIGILIGIVLFIISSLLG